MAGDVVGYLQNDQRCIHVSESWMAMYLQKKSKYDMQYAASPFLIRPVSSTILGPFEGLSGKIVIARVDCTSASAFR